VEALFVSVCQHSRLVGQNILLLSSDMHGILAKKVVSLSLQQPDITGRIPVCDIWF